MASFQTSFQTLWRSPRWVLSFRRLSGSLALDIAQKLLRLAGARRVEPKRGRAADAILAKEQVLFDEPRQCLVHLFDNLRNGFLLNTPARDALEAVGGRGMLQEIREHVSYALQRGCRDIFRHEHHSDDTEH